MTMNIDTQSKITSVNSSNTTSKTQKKSDASFSDELKNVSKTDSKEEVKDDKEIKADSKEEVKEEKEVKSDSKEEVKSENKSDEKVEKSEKENSKTNGIEKKDKSILNDNHIEDVIGGLQQTVEELNKLNQKNDKTNSELKKDTLSDDKDREDNTLIDNNINIKDKTEQQLPQMNANMNFNSNGQPFSAFVENTNNNNQLSASETDLAEENAILSTMNENIAIAQKNMLLNKNNQTDDVKSAKVELQPDVAAQNEVAEDVAPKTKTVTNEQGVKKVDTKTNVTTETVVKFDDIAMNKNDVEFFANLVENGSVDMNSVQHAQKSSQVSKTLADMIAKSMQDNQPIRINFDNDISVIIKVSKNGKISADFLPSSQIAEAYLKENLPILKQRFDDNNIDYDELNHRKQEQQDDRNNRKKGRKDE